MVKFCVAYIKTINGKIDTVNIYGPYADPDVAEEECRMKAESTYSHMEKNAEGCYYIEFNDEGFQCTSLITVFPMFSEGIIRSIYEEHGPMELRMVDEDAK